MQSLWGGVRGWLPLSCRLFTPTRDWKNTALLGKQGEGSLRSGRRQGGGTLGTGGRKVGFSEGARTHPSHWISETSGALTADPLF